MSNKYRSSTLYLFCPRAFKTRLDWALSNLVYWKLSLPIAGGLELDHLQGSFQPKPFSNGSPSHKRAWGSTSMPTGLPPQSNACSPSPRNPQKQPFLKDFHQPQAYHPGHWQDPADCQLPRHRSRWKTWHFCQALRPSFFSIPTFLSSASALSELPFSLKTTHCHGNIASYKVVKQTQRYVSPLLCTPLPAILINRPGLCL